VIRLDDIKELLKQGADLFHFFACPLDADRLSTGEDPRRERLLDLFQIAVELTQKSGRFRIITQDDLRSGRFDRLSPPKRWLSVAPVILTRTSSPGFIVPPVERWVSM
jgi:hypothetical protein